MKSFRPAAALMTTALPGQASIVYQFVGVLAGLETESRRFHRFDQDGVMNRTYTGHNDYSRGSSFWSSSARWMVALFLKVFRSCRIRHDALSERRVDPDGRGCRGVCGANSQAVADMLQDRGLRWRPKAYSRMAKILDARFEAVIMNGLHEERQRLGASAGVRNRISESAVAAAERVLGCGEPDLARSSTVAIAPVGSRAIHTR